MNPKNEVWLYVDNPNSTRPWELLYFDESGKELIVIVTVIHFRCKFGLTKIITNGDNITKPRCVVSFPNSKLIYRENSSVAFIDPI